jgi:aspartate dehydrogenase
MLGRCIYLLKVGLIGFGAIGKDIADYIWAHQAGNVELKAILVRNQKKNKIDSSHNCILTNDQDVFFDCALDIVIEAAGHEAIHYYGEKTLSSGADLIVISAGAFSDQNLFDQLQKTANKTKRQIIIPSGAIAGLDRITAAALETIEEIKLVTRKPPKVWYGTIAEEKIDLDTIQEPFCIFEGNARESAKLFPESINVSATLSLAGVGFENTKVQVWVDPTVHNNTHTICAKGYFGETEIIIQNTPSKNNPKSSYIVAMSIAKVLRDFTSPIVTGV